MNTTMKNVSRLALSAFLLSAFAADGWAQSSTKGPSGYGSTTANNIVRNNSASRFSADYLRGSLRNRSTASVGTLGVNRKNFLGGISSTPMSRKSKPFASVSRSPSVSPYASLSASRTSPSNYYNNNARSQQPQRRDNMLAIQQQRRLNQLAARAPYSTTGDESRAPTGHVAVFQSLGSYQNTANYFPPPSQPKRRRR